MDEDDGGQVATLTAGLQRKVSLQDGDIANNNVPAGATNNNNNNNNNKQSQIHQQQKVIRFLEARSPSSASSAAVPKSPTRQPGVFNRKSADWSDRRARDGFGRSGPTRKTELTVVVMGSSRVGKSAIINQFLHRDFRRDYCATVDDMHWIEFDAADADADANDVGTFLLKIIDASGSREFIGMRKLYEQQGDAFVLVAAVDDPGSLADAEQMRQEIRESNRKRAPVIFVLNKTDLLRDQQAAVRLMPEAVDQLALATGSLFVQATATRYDSVAEIFKRLLQQNRSIPAAEQLKYRRKSVPVGVGTRELGARREANKRRQMDDQCLDVRPESLPQKHSGCSIC